MLRVSCNNCPGEAYADCACPSLGHDPGAARAHHPECPFANLDALVTCIPGFGCCEADHDHGAAANACPGIGGGHPGEPCTIVHPHDPRTCAVCLDPARGEHGPEAGNGGYQCPGGHCGPKVNGCTVCRPVTITVLPGSAQVTLAARSTGG